MARYRQRSASSLYGVLYTLLIEFIDFVEQIETPDKARLCAQKQSGERATAKHVCRAPGRACVLRPAATVHGTPIMPLLHALLPGAPPADRSVDWNVPIAK